MPVDFRFADKLWHFLAYFWLAILPFGGFEPKKSILIASLLMVPLGVGLEIVQAFMPERDSSISDIIANILGTGFGIFSGVYFQRFQKHRAL